MEELLPASMVPVPGALPIVQLALSGLGEIGTDMNGAALFSECRAWVDEQVSSGAVLPGERALMLRLLRMASYDRMRRMAERREE